MVRRGDVRKKSEQYLKASSYKRHERVVEAEELADQLFWWYLDHENFHFDDFHEWLEYAVEMHLDWGYNPNADDLEELVEQSERIQNGSLDSDRPPTDLDELVENGEYAEPYPKVRALMDREILPEQFRSKAQKQLEIVGRGSDRSETAHTYLRTIRDLPWGKTKPDQDWSPQAVRDQLDESHYGLEDLKKRVAQELEIMKRTGSSLERVLCLCGPPGTGKTSIARAVSDALGRSFVKMNLGGLADSTEIIGHNSNYTDTGPGQVVRRLRKADSFHPIFLMDEIDKMNPHSTNGDPNSALLQLFDPEQNDSFQDNFLEAGLDLSEVFFIATANYEEQIPDPLYDRMEILEFEGYSDEQKVTIGRDFLLEEVREKLQLNEGELEFASGTLDRLVEEFTDTEGVRDLQKHLETLGREAALADGSLVVSPEDLDEYFDSSESTRLGFGRTE